MDKWVSETGKSLLVFHLVFTVFVGLELFVCIFLLGSFPLLPSATTGRPQSGRNAEWMHC